MAVMPGEIYWAYITEGEPHPVIIVSRETLNRGEYVTVVPVTSAHLATRWSLPNCVPFRAGQYGFIKRCVVQAEQLARLHKSYINLEAGPVGILDGDAMRKLIRAIGYVMSSECEPV